MTMHWRTLISTFLLVPLAATTCCRVFGAGGDGRRAPPSESTAGRERAGDAFCGPRCASFVLNHYGKQAELLDLVNEIQDRDWRQGSTLAAIEKALRARGLYTAAVRLSDSAHLQWPEPAIVHIEGDTTEIGHFVVALPGRSSGSDIALWFGLSGTRVVSRDWLRARRSGAALLVSAEPIGSLNDCVRPSRTKLVWSGVLAGAAIMLVSLRRASRIYHHHFNL